MKNVSEIEIKYLEECNKNHTGSQRISNEIALRCALNISFLQLL